MKCFVWTVKETHRKERDNKEDLVSPNTRGKVSFSFSEHISFSIVLIYPPCTPSWPLVIQVIASQTLDLQFHSLIFLQPNCWISFSQTLQFFLSLSKGSLRLSWPVYLDARSSCVSSFPFLIGALIPSLGPTLMASSKPNNLPKAPLPDAISAWYLGRAWSKSVQFPGPLGSEAQSSGLSGVPVTIPNS